MSVGWKHSLACAIHDGAPCSCKEDAAGPLAPLFAQVREGLARVVCTCESGTEDGGVDTYYIAALAALSVIERHVQDMETALREIPGKPPYRIAGIPSGIISSDDWDSTDEVLAFLAAALPAREKGEE